MLKEIEKKVRYNFIGPKEHSKITEILQNIGGFHMCLNILARPQTYFLKIMEADTFRVIKHLLYAQTRTTQEYLLKLFLADPETESIFERVIII